MQEKMYPRRMFLHRAWYEVYGSMWSHDCENFWNEEVDLENTELDEDDFDLEERIFEELH